MTSREPFQPWLFCNSVIPSKKKVSYPRCRRLSFAYISDHTVETVFLLGDLFSDKLHYYWEYYREHFAIFNIIWCFCEKNQNVFWHFQPKNFSPHTYITDKPKNSIFYLTVALNFLLNVYKPPIPKSLALVKCLSLLKDQHWAKHHRLCVKIVRKAKTYP